MVAVPQNAARGEDAPPPAAPTLSSLPLVTSGPHKGERWLTVAQFAAWYGEPHHPRNSAATDLVAAGLTIEDVMAVGGWKTAAVARRYNLGNLDALRARLAASRDRAGTVVPMRRKA